MGGQIYYETTAEIPENCELLLGPKEPIHLDGGGKGEDEQQQQQQHNEQQQLKTKDAMGKSMEHDGEIQMSN